MGSSLARAHRGDNQLPCNIMGFPTRVSPRRTLVSLTRVLQLNGFPKISPPLVGIPRGLSSEASLLARALLTCRILPTGNGPWCRASP
jgi:hypothetical protein